MLQAPALSDVPRYFFSFEALFFHISYKKFPSAYNLRSRKIKAKSLVCDFAGCIVQILLTGYKRLVAEPHVYVQKYRKEIFYAGKEQNEYGRIL